MRPALALLLALSISACRRAPPKTIAYASPDGRFTASLPATWTVDEKPGENRLVSFFSPAKGADAETVVVSFFADGGRWKTPQDYVYWRTTTGRSLPVAMAQAGGAPAVQTTTELTVQDPHSGLRVQRIRTLAFAARGGFFALEDYTDPARAGDDGAFEAFAASFRAAP